VIGSLCSIRVLRHALIALDLKKCDQVEGSLDDLKDFAPLEELDIESTKTTTGVRTIGANDRVSLKWLNIALKEQLFTEGAVFFIS
jgi:hypothetical protein